MGKSLIIAEKPSVAADIARALGGFTKKKDYFESDDYALSSAVGHLLELCAPEDCEVKRGKWSFEHLPVIPPAFDLNPIPKTETRLKLLSRLIRRKDIDCLINACDAGREGELIFRYIAQHAESKKPIRRLWLQSMTPTAIREGFHNLRNEAEMQPLAAAAFCRSESDWLVGINGTRAMTAFNSKTGGFHLTTVGRVQTTIIRTRGGPVGSAPGSIYTTPRIICSLTMTSTQFMGAKVDPPGARAPVALVGSVQGST